MTKIVYFSQTGQTRKFVNKIEHYEQIELTLDQHTVEMQDPFILVMPSYEENVHPLLTKSAATFLETADNRSYCKGLFGGGNRNFAELFCVTAKTLADTYELPLLHTFEFQGTPSDVQKMIEELEKIDNPY